MLMSKQEELYKQYLALEKRYWEIREELRKRPAIPLKEPYQHGWDVYFDFRDDVKNKTDFPAIKAAFDLVHSQGYTRQVKHIKRIRANRNYNSYLSDPETTKRWNWGVLPQLRLLRQHEYDQLPGDIKKWFALDAYTEKWASFQGHSYWLDIPRYWLEIKTRPHMITHRREKGGKLETEYEFIHSKLRMLWRKFSHNYSSSYPAYKDRCRVRASISRFKKGEAEDIPIEKIPREYDW